MGWRTVVIGTECKVSISMNRMKVAIGEEYHNYPLTDLDVVIFSHNKLTVTIPLLAKLVENNIGIIICDEKNDPIGIFQPFNCHSLVFKQLKNQISWKITRKKKLWKMIIEDKIQSEINTLQRLKLNQKTINQLNIYHNSVYNEDQTNREAICARLYFQELFGKEFTRDDMSATNNALNYGYKIFASFISKCISARGLVTQLGIHHIGESNPYNLTYDFIEPFRAIIDQWVYLNIKDEFNTFYKFELIALKDNKVFVNNKWMRINDAIECVIDSYIAFLNEESDKIITVDLSKGIKEEI